MKESINVEDIFSTGEEVLSELAARWNDQELGDQLNDFLVGDIPAPLLRGPRACLFRQLLSFDNETKEFQRQSRQLGLRPFNFEFLSDKFTTVNHGKACLGKMTFFHGLDKNNQPVTSSKRVIDLSGINENKRLQDINTLSGESLVDFHHRILHACADIELSDASEWFKRMGGTAKIYYRPYMALSTIRHVLFENFEEGREDRFFHEVFYPALEFVKKEFGLKPLIMPIAPQNDLNNKYWWCYPESVKDMVER